MIEERIQYGIDNFLEDNFFLPFSNSYCLEEKSETGRSKLHVDVQGDVVRIMTIKESAIFLRKKVHLN